MLKFIFEHRCTAEKNESNLRVCKAGNACEWVEGNSIIIM